VESAGDDLRYLEAWRQGKTATEVVGNVVPNARGNDQDWQRYYRAIEAAVVRVDDPAGRAVNARVDRQGYFSVAVPEAGRYVVSVALPKWVADRPPVTATVPHHGCAETHFSMRPDGQVIGKAIEADGSPARGVLLKLVTTGDVIETVESRTDENGRFQFRGVLRGSYPLGVNPERLDDPSPRVPYAPSLYPGVREEKRAKVIKVPEFAAIQLQEPFRLPPRAKPRMIRVTVVLEDGRPLLGASVSCTPEGRPYWQKEAPNSDGVVHFAAMDNVSYIVDADIPSYHRLAKAGYQRSQWVRVGPANGATDVRLVFRKP
jgi:hypothetical protein